MHTHTHWKCCCTVPMLSLSHQIDADTYWNDVTSQAAKMVLRTVNVSSLHHGICCSCCFMPFPPSH